MPSNPEAARRGVLNSLHFGEVPKTRFVDWLDAINVQMLTGPTDDLRYAMREMKQATWADSVERAWQMADSSEADGHPLPMFNEAPSFIFRADGISRIIAQQITRTRLGVFYSMQGTGDQDCRHRDVLVPRALCRPGSEYFLETYMMNALQAKVWYARALDAGHSLVMARYALPQNLSGFIYIGINLLALQGLVGNRLCTYETQEYNEVARQMVERMKTHYPEYASGLVSNCDRPGGCHYMRAKNPAVAGSMYFPDERHDVYEWNPDDFVYKMTRDEALAGPAFKEQNYVGFARVDE